MWGGGMEGHTLTDTHNHTHNNRQIYIKTYTKRQTDSNRQTKRLIPTE